MSTNRRRLITAKNTGQFEAGLDAPGHSFYLGHEPRRRQRGEMKNIIILVPIEVTIEYLKKTWVRVIISLIAAGISMEIVWLATASDPNAERPPAISFGVIVLTVVFNFGITKMVKKK